jgi:heme exporter protein D
MSAYFSMGGYAGYVWPAYGVAAVVMVGVLMASLLGARARERELKLLQELRPHRARRSGNNAAKAAEEASGADA